ncbi:MAG: ABC transporter ATP-binding protein [Spirochaetales bacterium]|nr:ABC transporter ATP-binding protein [Spirochaetales bacterium]
MAAITLQDVSAQFSDKPMFFDKNLEIPLKHVFKAAKNIEIDKHMQEEIKQVAPNKSVKVLDQINLTIPDGQTLAVVGPSGCGKSTLLRVVAGLQDYKGHVYYDDQDMAAVPPAERYIGMVFQNYALYPHFKSKGNLGFFFKVHKASDKEAEERIRVTSEIMGIGFKELLQRRPGTLSGGQQQRVAIARALVRGPRLFLFDEPLSNLDAKQRAATRIEIKRLLQRFKITAIYVTHDQLEAVSLGDKIAVIREGRLEQLGTYNELLSKPVNVFIADFIGSPLMNLFPEGAVNDGVLSIADDLNIPLPKNLKSRFKNGQTVILGVRPEAVFLTGDAANTSAMVIIPGTVEGTEPDVTRQKQTVHLQARKISCRALVPLAKQYNPKTKVNGAFSIADCYFFDGETQKRIDI